MVVPDSEKKQDPNKLNKYGLYELTKLNNPESEVRQTYNRIVKPLTIFAPYINEDDSDLYYYEDETVENKVSINDEVKEPPATLERFLEHVKNRLVFKRSSCLTEDDQEELVNIVISEVKMKYRELKKIINDPLQDETNNIELRRRIFVNTINICEKLFKLYVEKAEILRKRHVFYNSANLTRLKSLLMVDLRKCIDIHAIRRNLAADMRQEQIEDDDFYIDNIPKEALKVRRSTIRDATTDIHLRYNFRRKRYKTKQEHLKELMDSMPVLETKKIEKLLNKVQMSINRQKSTNKTQTEEQPSILIPQKEGPNDSTLIENLANQDSNIEEWRLVKRCKSMPKLQEGKMDEEFDFDRQFVIRDKFKTTDSVKLKFEFGLKTHEDISKNAMNYEDLKQKDEKTIAKKLKDDLENLAWRLTRKDLNKYDKNDDSPALLMTLMTKPDHLQRMKEVQDKIKFIDDKYKKFQEEIKLKSIKPSSEHIQPSTIESHTLTNFPIRLSDIRISTREFRYNICLQSFGPIYNEMNKEIDSDMIKLLNSNLYIGDEIKNVYSELMKTLKEDHLLFELDDYVHPVPDKLDHRSNYMSTLLYKFGRNKYVNKGLEKENYKEAPWKQLEYREWNKTPISENMEYKTKIYRPVKGKPKLIRPFEVDAEKMRMYEEMDPTRLTKKEYKNWLEWWQDHYTTEDYFKFLSTQENDYLGLVFHLYDADKAADADLTDEDMKIIENRTKAEAEKQKLIESLKKEKEFYQEGTWNPKAVLFGGLGRDPELDESVDPVKQFEKSLERPKTKTKKLQLFKPEEKNEVDLELERIKKEREMKRLREEEKKKGKTPQQRLEEIWNLLLMSEDDKLNMAVKYCSDPYFEFLLQAIEDWEKTTNYIIQRENIIYELEKFEINASDPNRFFQKGKQGNSGERLKEARIRDSYYKRIDELDYKIKKYINIIQEKYNDTVTYNHRPYLDKMKWDRIEMLHYLQEERRKKYFQHEATIKNLPNNLIDLCT